LHTLGLPHGTPRRTEVDMIIVQAFIQLVTADTDFTVTCVLVWVAYFIGVLIFIED
jgi:hypothetical protein